MYQVSVKSPNKARKIRASPNQFRLSPVCLLRVFNKSDKKFWVTEETFLLSEINSGPLFEGNHLSKNDWLNISHQTFICIPRIIHRLLLQIVWQLNTDVAIVSDFYHNEQYFFAIQWGLVFCAKSPFWSGPCVKPIKSWQLLQILSECPYNCQHPICREAAKDVKFWKRFF